jgi:hypothetical protein
VTAVAIEPDGGTSTSTFTYAVNNGENFVTILSSGGERLACVTIDSLSGFQDLRQPRISGVSVPVPDSGSSLACLCFFVEPQPAACHSAVTQLCACPSSCTAEFWRPL